ncbi:MAG: NADH-quinone oxidoreductase subunit M [Ignavibacteriae bacterium]|nr:NADH-quinone oxidoreductase subunit M [Ignavibacteriota bacterium]
MTDILTYLIFLPMAGSVLLFFLKKERVATLKVLGFVFSLLTFGLSFIIYFAFDPSNAGFQFARRILWVPSLNISYYVGIDGISLMLVLLTTFLTPLALLSSWKSIEKRVKEYTIMMLLLETGMLGVFCALDMFLFYIFWEAMLIPMYFIIGMWGGENRIYAAIKFFLYTMVGSLLMLVAIIWLGYYASTQPNGRFTTDLLQLYSIAPAVPLTIQTWMFLAFTFSFAIKVPLFPFHTWLPDAHVEAPTAGSVILAGVLLKMGTYGLLRFSVPLFPDATIMFAPYIALLAVIGIIYGALVSMVQTDIKKLVAYSSVSHLGFVVLGIFALTEEGIQGSIIQMINHGLSTGALFLIVGMIYERRHTRMISEFGGLANVMPLFATFFMIVSLSSLGLPGLNGFIGEFLILVGAFKSTYLSQWFAIFSSTGVILAAVYLLWMYQRVVFGKMTNPINQNLSDLSKREIAVLAPVLLFIVWIGVYPGTFLQKSHNTTKHIISVVKQYTQSNLTHSDTTR